MNEYSIKKHSNCNLSIRWKLFKDRPTPTAGLFCQDHNEFIMWLDDRLAFDLIDNHKITVEVYTPRPTKNQRKAKTRAIKRSKSKPKIPIF